MDPKILICVPTCSRSEMVLEVLSHEIDYYHKLGIHICYFDSSEDEATKKIICSFIRKGYSNLYYKKMSKGLCIDYKIIEILKNKEMLLQYQYIWLINDSISIIEDALSEIIKLARENYTLIRLPLSGGGEKQDRIYFEQNEWFHNCSQGMAHMASTLMNTELLKPDTDWTALREKYVGSNELDDPNHGFFFTVGFYLEQILQIKQFKGLFIGNRMKWRRDSPYKKEKSYWSERVFSVWARSYCETILKLPDYYTKKQEVIRLSDNIMVGRFGRQAIIGYRIRGMFTIRTFLSCYHYWSYVTDVPRIHLLALSLLPGGLLRMRYGGHYGDPSHWETRLIEMENIIGIQPVIVYGAGVYGERVVKKLQEDGFGRQIVCIAVTDREENVEAISDIKVKAIDDLLDLKNTFVLIATLPDTAKKIRKHLIEKGFHKILSLF